MKKLTKVLMMLAAVLCVGLSSCMKEYNPKSYAPPLNIGGYTSSSEIAKGNLVAYYAFDGSLADSVSGTAGVNTGTSFAGAGIKKQALQGALSSYVLADPSTAVKGLTSFTVSYWVNTPPPSTGIIGVFSLAKTTAFWGNLEVFFENGSTNDNGKVRIHIAQGNNDNTLAVDGVQNLFSKWVSMAISYDAATSKCTLYVNGAKITSGAAGGLSGPLAFTDIGKLVFGCVQFQTKPSQTSATDSQDWASYLTGALDEVRIYNKALTADEIGAIAKLQGRGK